MLNLTGGGLSGGYRKYLQHVVPRLQNHRAVSELLVVVPPGQQSHAGTDGSVWSWAKNEHWRGYPALADRVRTWKPDVVLIPTARYINCGAPVVSMVRNMEPMLPRTLRDGFAPSLKNIVGAHLARDSVKQSQRVIAVSQFVRDFLLSAWTVDEERVGVVYHGVDPATAASEVTTALQPLSTRPFLFVAGSLLPYRGIEDALRALSLLSKAQPALLLAIAGSGSAGYAARLRKLAEELKVTSQVIWLGQLTTSEMAWAYQSCVAFLMTSRVEACPNTALEAMQTVRCASVLTYHQCLNFLAIRRATSPRTIRHSSRGTLPKPCA
ncbi:MAG: glycosyltransferase family 4 protein [Gemmatimonadota bacterium]|nr:glycosyltransferase family 4 protein [Gemmatimonadota bacterium]